MSGDRIHPRRPSSSSFCTCRGESCGRSSDLRNGRSVRNKHLVHAKEDLNKIGTTTFPRTSVTLRSTQWYNPANHTSFLALEWSDRRTGVAEKAARHMGSRPKTSGRCTSDALERDTTLRPSLKKRQRSTRGRFRFLRVACVSLLLDSAHRRDSKSATAAF